MQNGSVCGGGGGAGWVGGASGAAVIVADGTCSGGSGSGGGWFVHPVWVPTQSGPTGYAFVKGGTNVNVGNGTVRPGATPWIPVAECAVGLLLVVPTGKASTGS